MSGKAKSLSRRQLLAHVGGMLGAAALAACAQTKTETVEREVTRVVAGTPVVQKVVETVVVPVEKATPIKEGPATIRWWHVWGGTRLPMVEEQIKDFKALHPDITVQHLLVDQATMNEKYLTAMASGDPPDVIMVHGRYFPKFAPKGTLASLDSLLVRDKMNLGDIFYEAEYKMYQWEGKTFALPLATGGAFYFLLSNMDQLAEAGYSEPPKTWQELEGAAQKLTVKQGTTIKRLAFNNVGFENFPYKEWLFLNNGAFINADAKQFQFGSSEGKETLQWMTDFNNRLYGGYQSVAGFTGGATDPFRNQIMSMYVIGVWGFKDLLDKPPAFKWVASDMPYNASNSKAEYLNIVEGGWSYGIPKLSKHVDAAWEFVKYTTAGEGNLKFMKGMYRCSPVKKFNDDPWFAEKNPYWSVVQKALARGKYSPTTPVQTETDTVITDMMQQALYGKQTPEKAIEWGLKETQRMLDNYWAKA